MTESTSCKLPTHRLLSAARPLEPIQPGKIVLPLSSARTVLPGAVNILHVTSQVPDLYTARLLVADPKKWLISSLRTAPRIGGYQVRGSHPALSDPGPESSAKLPLLPVNDGISLEFEYIGPQVNGEPFVACLCMEDGQDRTSPVQPDRKDSSTLSFLAESLPVSPGEQICLPLPARAHDFFVSGLTLRGVEPSHWLINDVIVGSDTLLIDDGDLPGELLADRPERVPLRLGRLRAKEELIVKATYIGPLASAALSYEVLGSEMPLRETAADTAFLPMSSSATADGGSLCISSKVSVPTGFAFVPEEVVLRDPDNWIMVDVRMGMRLLFAALGEVPGALFGARTRGCRLNFPAVSGGQSLSTVVGYIGTHIASSLFVCGAVGRIVRLPSVEG